MNPTRENCPAQAGRTRRARVIGNALDEGDGIMSYKRFVPVLELFLIVVVPFMTVGFDILEDTRAYNQLFDFATIENTIHRFKTDYAQSTRKGVFQHSEPKEYTKLWKLIQSYTHTPLRKERPYAITMLKVNNPQTVSLPYTAPDVVLIPESAPIVAVYQEFSDGTKIPGKDVVIVGTIADLERWFLNAKKTTRIVMNMSVSLLSILLGLFIHFGKKAEQQKGTESSNKSLHRIAQKSGSR